MLSQLRRQAGQGSSFHLVGGGVDEAHYQPILGSPGDELLQQPLADLVRWPDHARAGPCPFPGLDQLFRQHQGVRVEAFGKGRLAQRRPELAQGRRGGAVRGLELRARPHRTGQQVGADPMVGDRFAQQALGDGKAIIDIAFSVAGDDQPEGLRPQAHHFGFDLVQRGFCLAAFRLEGIAASIQAGSVEAKHEARGQKNKARQSQCGRLEPGHR